MTDDRWRLADAGRRMTVGGWRFCLSKGELYDGTWHGCCIFPILNRNIGKSQVQLAIVNPLNHDITCFTCRKIGCRVINIERNCTSTGRIAQTVNWTKDGIGFIKAWANTKGNSNWIPRRVGSYQSSNIPRGVITYDGRGICLAVDGPCRYIRILILLTAGH